MSSWRSQSTFLVLILLPKYLVLQSVNSSVPSSRHFQTTHEAFIEAKMSDAAGVSHTIPSLMALTGTRSQASRTEGEKCQWVRRIIPRPWLWSEQQNLCSHPNALAPPLESRSEVGTRQGFWEGTAEGKLTFSDITFWSWSMAGALLDKTSELQSTWEFLSQLDHRHDRRRLPLLSTSYMPSSVTVLFLGGLGPASHCSLSVLPPLLF